MKTLQPGRTYGLRNLKRIINEHGRPGTPGLKAVLDGLHGLIDDKIKVFGWRLYPDNYSNVHLTRSGTTRAEGQIKLKVQLEIGRLYEAVLVSRRKLILSGHFRLLDYLNTATKYTMQTEGPWQIIIPHNICTLTRPG